VRITSPSKDRARIFTQKKIVRYLERKKDGDEKLSKVTERKGGAPAKALTKAGKLRTNG